MGKEIQRGSVVVALALVMTVGAFGFWRGSQPEPLDETVEAVQRKFPDVQQLSTKELAQWLRETNRPQPLLLDVREQQEFAVSHLRSARLAVPGSDVAASVADVEKQRAIVAYCSVGYRSSKTAQELHHLGYTNVYNLEGALFKWANEGREIVRHGEPVREVHPYNAKWGRFLDRKFWATEK